MSPLHYSINIQWSDENQAFLVDVPELPGCHTHGETYEEAIKNAVEVINYGSKQQKKWVGLFQHQKLQPDRTC